jgi:hypothetical protein
MIKIQILAILLSIIVFSCKNEVSHEVNQIVKPLNTYTSFHALDTLPSLITEKLANKATTDGLSLLILKTHT